MKETINNLKFTWNYVKEEKNLLIKYIICDILSIIISIIIPVLSAKIIINLTDNKLNQLIYITFLIFIIENMRNLINRFSRYCMQTLYRKSLTKLEIDLGRNILKLENKVIDEKGSGVFIQRLTNDTARLADIFPVLNIYLTHIITYIGIFFAIFIINKIIFIYLFVMMVVLFIIERVRVKKYNEKDKEFRRKMEKVSGFITELVRGARDIKMLNSEENFMYEFEGKIYETNDTRYKMQKVDRVYRFFRGFTLDLNDFLLIVLIVFFIKNNTIDIATALVVYNYSSKITPIVDYVGTFLEKIKDFNLSSNRISNIINSEEYKKEQFGKKHIKKIKGDFEFKNVSFKYNDTKKVLDNISFKIAANHTIAFVGKSGAGKTTIFNLLCKMYDTYDGEILIDGNDIKKLDKDTIRGNITIISQNPYIFNLSIKDNLKIVKQDVTEEEIKNACKLACLDEFINDLENGYDTIVGEGGVNLSGGQKQRLAIARALIQKTEIILFDEATSALDNETQEKIKQAIDNMKNEYTILIIAHRLSTIIDCDNIMFLNNGKIENSGSHLELLKKCDNYKKLYENEINKGE